MFKCQSERGLSSVVVAYRHPARLARLNIIKRRADNCGRFVVDDAREQHLERQVEDDRQDARQIDAHELQHRIKNMLSVIGALCRQTMRQSETKEEFEKQFTARLLSYSKSIDLLIANDWQGLEIGDLVRSQLATFGFLDGDQIAAAGPRLQLSGPAAHNLGLALHELATNAAKYGALSVPEGRICIDWTILKTDSGERFCLRWQESGGPIVGQPTHRGFGSRVIQTLSSSAISGHTDYEFLPEGVRWSIDAPVASALVALYQKTGLDCVR